MVRQFVSLVIALISLSKFLLSIFVAQIFQPSRPGRNDICWNLISSLVNRGVVASCVLRIAAYNASLIKMMYPPRIGGFYSEVFNAFNDR